MTARRSAERFDLAVVGAGIVGLATALAGCPAGLAGRRDRSRRPGQRRLGAQFRFCHGDRTGARTDVDARAAQPRGLARGGRRSRHSGHAHGSVDDRAPAGVRWRTGSIHGDRNGRGMPSAESGGGTAPLSAACGAGHAGRSGEHDRIARRVAGGDPAPRKLAGQRAWRHVPAPGHRDLDRDAAACTPRAARCRRSGWRYAPATISTVCMRTVSAPTH